MTGNSQPPATPSSKRQRTHEQHTRMDELVAELARGQRTTDIQQIRQSMTAHMERLSFPSAAADQAAVTPEGVAYVGITAPDAARPTCALLYVHGGGFVCGTAGLYASFVAYISQVAGAAAYIPDYRLAPEFPYPAAIDDTVAVWREMLREYASTLLPTRIVVMADSAGASIALQAFEVMRQESPSPANAIVLMSPLVDLTASAPSLSLNIHHDPLVTQAGVKAMARMYAPGQNPGNPAISPIYADFTGYPPMLVQASSTESLRDDAASLVSRARANGVRATLVLTPGMPHVWQVFAGFLDEAKAAVEQAAQFVRITSADR